MIMCAECRSTLKNDYLTPFPVKDVTELLTGIETPEPARLDFTVTYHDPCHLMNGQGIRNQPRDLLTRVAGNLLRCHHIAMGQAEG